MSGFEAVEAATAVLQRARREHPIAGPWEAADVQWWWRTPRPTDDVERPVWTDDAGPVATVLLTAWRRSVQTDAVVTPSRRDLLGEVWRAAAELAKPFTPLETVVDDVDSELNELVLASGFKRSDGPGATAWMESSDRPAVSALPSGYRLRDRTQTDRVHHFTKRNGPEAGQRLAQTSLYRPDLDLFVETEDGEVAGYGLFWHDPVTKVGMVEPMRTEEGHEGQGLARHVLTAGLDRLALLGATRLKVNFEPENERAAALYQRSGFVVGSTSWLYVRG